MNSKQVTKMEFIKFKFDVNFTEFLQLFLHRKRQKNIL